MWEISQKFGLRVKKLMMKNRMNREVDLKPGRVLWMRFIRPGDVEVQYKNVPTLAKAEKESLIVSAPEKQKPHRGTIIDSKEDDTIFEYEDDVLESKQVSVQKSKSNKVSKLKEKAPIKIRKNEELQSIIDRKNPASVDAFSTNKKTKFIEIAAPSSYKKK